jgi:hypothetical protein
VGEVALALLLTWLLFRSDFARHAGESIRLAAGDYLILIAMAACLAFFVFLLVFWQWRLSARGRWRLLLAMFLSLLWSFCGYCWHDISLATADLVGPHGRTAYQRVVEETMAVSVAIGALVAGMMAVIVILWLERRALNSQGAGAIVEDDTQDSGREIRP